MTFGAKGGGAGAAQKRTGGRVTRRPIEDTKARTGVHPRTAGARFRAGVLSSAAVLAVLLAWAPASRAGTIGFQIESTVKVADGARLRVTLRNTGDETAFKVVPAAAFGGRKAARGDARNIVAGGTSSWTLPLAAKPPPPGNYVAELRIAYEDANSYPFEVVAVAPFSLGTSPREAITGRVRLTPIPASGTGRGTISLEVPEQRGHRLAIKLLLPAGVRSRPLRRVVDIGENRALRIPFEVENTSLLEGTRVDLYALVTALDESPRQTDVVRGMLSIGARPAGRTAHRSRIWLFAAFLVVVAALELWAFVRGFRPEGSPLAPLLVAADVLLVVATTGFLLYHYPWNDLLARTVTAGGDMASLFYPARLMAEEILPRGEWTGWTMGNYAGFPVFHFYSTLPFVLIAVIGQVAPMEQTFKLVTLLGPTMLPLAAAWLFRVLGYSRAASSIAAVAVIPFLFQQGNSMWGGNIPSVLAGEFCHAIGLTLSLVFLGLLHRAATGRGNWPLVALVLAAIGLSHTFAFFAAVWYSLFYLWPQRGLERSARPLFVIYAITFLLLCFWGLPLPARLVYTTEWSMIWRIKDWQEVLPAPLWPAAALAGIGLLASAVRIKEFRWQRQGLLVFTFGGGVLLYFLVPALGFPDIRFVPVAQLFLSLVAADTVAWLIALFPVQTLVAALVVAAGLSWGQAHLGYIPSWLHWNYSGYEGKATWPEFKRINDHLRGDLNDPRVVFEHSQTHNRFGSSRAFENLPLFSGRATLEGVFHQASLSSPFIFYLQSEASERGSGPFPQHTYTRLNLDAALPHFRMFNVGDVIVVSEKARKAYSEHPAFEETLRTGMYSVFHIRDGATGYVVPAANEPVLYEPDDFKLAFYRWYRHPEMLDVPLVPRSLISSRQASRFELRTDSITRLPRQPLAGSCHVSSTIEQYRIHFETDCPGRPHIVKVSYFPRWHAADGSEIVPVSPGFMLIRPKHRSVDIVYRRNAIDWIGLALTLIGLGLLCVCFVHGPTRDRFEEVLAEPWMPLLSAMQRRRVILAPLLVLCLAAVAAGTRYHLRSDEWQYRAAQEAYRARDFERAAALFSDWIATDRDTFKQATALYQLGITYSELDRPAAAIEIHERLRFEFPNVDYGAGTLFHLARNYERLNERERAREYAAKLIADYGDSGWAQRLRRELPDLLEQTAQSPSKD